MAYPAAYSTLKLFFRLSKVAAVKFKDKSDSWLCGVGKSAKLWM